MQKQSNNIIAQIAFIAQKEAVSYFATSLKTALEEHQMSQADLCRVTGIGTGQISRYVNDTNEPEREGLGKICQAFPQQTKAKLIAARLLDCIPDVSENLVQISIIDPNPVTRTSEDPAPYSSLPRDVREALEYLSQEARTSKGMREAIVSWVNVMRD